MDSSSYEEKCNFELCSCVILFDVQHCSVLHDVEIVMLNGLMPWGNNHLLPRGPLREPLNAVVRADLVVIHHSDLVCVFVFC